MVIVINIDGWYVATIKATYTRYGSFYMVVSHLKHFKVAYACHHFCCDWAQISLGLN